MGLTSEKPLYATEPGRAELYDYLHQFFLLEVLILQKEAGLLRGTLKRDAVADLVGGRHRRMAASDERHGAGRRWRRSCGS